MAPQYSIDELLLLRDSPLVSKPPGLRPSEEWMGPAIDQQQTAIQPKNIKDRRSGGDSKTKHISEDFLLGPPRTAFASTGRSSARSAEDRHLGNDDDPKSRPGQQNRLAKEGRRGEKEELGSQESDSLRAFRGRGIRDDHHPWSTSSREIRSTKDEKGDFRRKHAMKDYERDKDQDHEKSFRGFDSMLRPSHYGANGEASDRKARTFGPRDGHPWSHGRDRSDGEVGGGDRIRPRNLRDRTNRAHPDHESPWVRGVQQDEDPLWVSEGLESPRKEKHGPTQADFEEFRAMMKSQKVKGPRNNGTEEVTPEPGADINQAALGSPKFKNNPGLDLGDLPDKFYDLMGAPRGPTTQSANQQEDNANTKTKGSATFGRASKFSSLFGGDPQPTTNLPVPILPPEQDASNEDRAGFQRILSLLGQQQQSQRDDQNFIPPSNHMPMNMNEGRAPSMQEAPVNQPRQSGEALKTRDSEFLLKLMRQAPQTEQPESTIVHQAPENIHGGAPPFHNFQASPPFHHPHPSGPLPGFFDDPPRHPMLGHEKMNSSDLDSSQDYLNENHRPPHIGLPPGLERRPPGFDQGGPMYPPHVLPHQGMGPPPGFPPNIRGINTGPSGILPPRSNGPGMPPPPPPGFLPSVGPIPGRAQPPGFGPGGSAFGGAPGYDPRQPFPSPGHQRP